MGGGGLISNGGAQPTPSSSHILTTENDYLLGTPNIPVNRRIWGCNSLASHSIFFYRLPWIQQKTESKIMNLHNMYASN